MSFEQPQFEKSVSPSLEEPEEGLEQKGTRREGLGGLKDSIKEISLELRKEGIPVDENARVDINKFRNVYSKESIESDSSWVKKLKEQWERAAASDSRWSWVPNKEKAPKDIPVGDVFEMLATSVLSKFLGKDFVVTRTSEYDDVRNKVDNLILEKETGNIICAFDEVGSASGERFEEKRNKVLERNWQRGGADLKYGISYEKEGDEMKLKKGAIYQIPLFYLALSQGEIKRTLDDSRQDIKIFQEFISSAKEQIKEIKNGPVHSKLKGRLDFFEKVIEKF